MGFSCEVNSTYRIQSVPGSQRKCARDGIKEPDRAFVNGRDKPRGHDHGPHTDPYTGDNIFVPSGIYRWLSCVIFALLNMHPAGYSPTFPGKINPFLPQTLRTQKAKTRNMDSKNDPCEKVPSMFRFHWPMSGRAVRACCPFLPSRGDICPPHVTTCYLPPCRIIISSSGDHSNPGMRVRLMVT